MENLWPGNVVGLEVITRAIFELRKVLHDDPKQPKYIETIARKGYCFIGEVTPLASSISQDHSSHLLLKKTPRRKALLTSIVFFFVVLMYMGSKTELVKSLLTPFATVKHFQETILSDGIGGIQSAALSSDWSQILYINTPQDSQDSLLIMKNVNSHKTSVLTQSKNKYRSIIWGKNQSSAYFVECMPESCKINHLPQLNNKVRSIYKTNKQIKQIDLSPSGQYIAITAMDNYRLIISLLDTESQLVTLLPFDKNTTNYFPKFDSAESNLFFIQQDKTQLSVKKHHLTSNKTSVVSTKFSKITSLHIEDDEHLLIAGRTSNHYGVWRLNINNNEVTLVLSVPASSYAYNLTSNQHDNQLFYLKKSSNIDVAAKGLAKNINFKRLNSHANDFNAIWSEQQHSIYFVSQRTGNYELWEHKENANNKLTDLLADSIKRPILNNEQSEIAFITAKNNKLKIIIYSIDKEEIIFNKNINNVGHLLSWSTDNSHIYISIASQNIYDIWALDIAKNELTKVSLSSGLIAKELKNKDFYFGDIKNQQLMIKKTNGTTAIIKKFKGIALEFRPYSIKLSEKADHLYYVVKETSVLKVMSTTLETDMSRQTKAVFTLSANDYVTDLGEKNHGKGEPYVLYDHLISKSSQLVLIQAVE